MSEKNVLLVELLLAEKDVDAEEAECWFAFEVATRLALLCSLQIIFLRIIFTERYRQHA